MKRSLRVLHLIAHLGRGGTEGQLALLLSHLEPERVCSKVVVLSPSANEVWEGVLKGQGVGVENLADSRGVVARALRIAGIARRFEADLIQSWTLHANAYAAVAGRMARARRWGSVRGSLTSPGWRALSPMTRRLCLRGVDSLVVNAGALGEELVEQGIDRRRILEFPNAVERPVEPMSPAQARVALGSDPDAILFGSIGNLRRIKNHELFLAGLARVAAQEPGAQGVIIGQPLASEPDYPAELEGLRVELGLESVVSLVGFREDAARLATGFRALVLTSHSEGMPNAILEAAAAGRPAAAEEVGGVPELIEHGVTGLLVPPDDVEALADAMIALARNPEKAEAMGRAAKERVEREHDPAELAGRWLAAYEGALR